MSVRPGDRSTLPDLGLHARCTLQALLRRRMTVAILVVLPLTFHLVTHDSVGRSVRALVFGICWAVSTVAFFATLAGRELDPRLRLAGRSRRFLTGARTTALVVLALALALGFWALVAVSLDVRDLAGVGIDFAVTALVAVAFGTAVGSLPVEEMEGTLVLFFFAGLQAVANPFDGYSRFLPFWSSRELGTYAIDGPAHGSLLAGLLHAAIVVAVCAAVVVVVPTRWQRR